MLQQVAGDQPAGAPVAEWCGAHVLVRGDDDATRERAFLAGLPSAPGQLFVMASPGAYGRASLADELGALLSLLFEERSPSRPVEALWLAVAGLLPDRDAVARLSEKLEVDVLVPDGPLTVVPGTGVHVGARTGGTGWLRFRADVPAWPFSTRFPPPQWESAAPARTVGTDDLVAEPVLAGLVVRQRTAPPVGVGDLALRIALDARAPRLVIGGTGPAPGAADTAQLLRRLPPGLLGRIVLVPADPTVAGPAWLAELVASLGRPVVLATGAPCASPTGVVSTVALTGEGRPGFRPCATVVRQLVDGGQEVLDVAPAPPGWESDGRTAYRSVGNPDVVAEVVPDGLLVRRAAAGRFGAEPCGATFDPERWILRLGLPGEVVERDLVDAAASLLGGMDRRQRAAAQVRITGSWDGGLQEPIRRLTRDLGVPVLVPRSPVVAAPPRATETASTATAATDAALREGERGTAAAATPQTPQTPQPAAPAPTTAPAERWAAAGPIRTVSTGPGPITSAASLGTGDAAGEDGTAIDDPASTADAGDPQTGASEPEAAPTADPDEAPGPVSDDVPPDAVDGPVPAAVVEAPAAAQLVDRWSTATEQARFAAATGETYLEALATVNAALSTWPALRQGDARGTKADLVAVCLFLGQGDTAAAELNSAVRAGRAGVVDGHLACLVSGIRRLPLHRRPVLRQGSVTERMGGEHTVGRLWTEPGFLSASLDMDVTAPGADLDVLIWPASARRTSELLAGRPVNEAVFVAGARFKALAVRATDDEPEPDAEGAPRVAVLIRELAPGEAPPSADLDDRDLAALAKLDRALQRRWRSAVRVLDDPPTAARLTTTMIELSAAGDADGPVSVTSAVGSS